MLDVEKVRQVLNLNVVYAELIPNAFGDDLIRASFRSGRQRLIPVTDEQTERLTNGNHSTGLQ
jgi:hypothetical protein